MHASPQDSLQVEIREMYRDKSTGELKPTQKGLALTAVWLHCLVLSNVKFVVHFQPFESHHDTFHTISAGPMAFARQQHGGN